MRLGQPLRLGKRLRVARAAENAAEVIADADDQAEALGQFKDLFPRGLVLGSVSVAPTASPASPLVSLSAKRERGDRIEFAFDRPIWSRSRLFCGDRIGAIFAGGDRVHGRRVTVAKAVGSDPLAHSSLFRY
jgi:hypothetical protein